MTKLYERLLAYGNLNVSPFHMPGHKRKKFSFGNPFAVDITEIDGFDNLHHPTGILKEAMEQAAAVYGAEKSYFLVNGSSCWPPFPPACHGAGSFLWQGTAISRCITG